MTDTPVKLTLYNGDNEVVKELVRHVLPWKLVKKSIRLFRNSAIEDSMTEEDADAIANLVVEIFGQEKVTLQELDDCADIGDMVSVITSIIARANKVVSPTLPPSGKKKK
jgi:hypothetical protein